MGDAEGSQFSFAFQISLDIMKANPYIFALSSKVFLYMFKKER